jgi:hypothetical protein
MDAPPLVGSVSVGRTSWATSASTVILLGRFVALISQLNTDPASRQGNSPLSDADGAVCIHKATVRREQSYYQSMPIPAPVPMKPPS